MGAQLRFVLDQLVEVVHADQASASLSLLHGLLGSLPRGCDVEVLVPAGAQEDLSGVSKVRKLSLARRELAASWQLGIVPGVSGGLIHAPTLMAPLVKHDRVHENDQTVVTLWDLDAWQAPESLPKALVAWHRAMLKRAAKHADAIIVPSHAIAEQLTDLAKVGDRIRVISGAAPTGFAVPNDDVERRVGLDLPQRYIAAVGPVDALAPAFRGAAASDHDIVVMDAAVGSEPRIAEAASAAGLPERRVHVRTALEASDRAALLRGATVLASTHPHAAWPWRVVEALSLGTPLVVVDTPVHADVLVDGGVLVSREDMPGAIEDAVAAGNERLRVLSADRGRAFSWVSAAERVWALHADL